MSRWKIRLHFRRKTVYTKRTSIYEMTIISAHREPDVFFEYAKSAESKGFKVIIAGAGMAAHLPGMCAAIFPMPVIGIPMHTTSLGGRDSLILSYRCRPVFR